jgi:O-antigen/teichoic acid export membrane protein
MAEVGLVRGTGVRLTTHVAAGLLSLVALPLLFRHLGAADFGRYVAVLSIVGIAVLASDVGITAIALRDSALTSGQQRRELLAGLLGARVAIALVGAVGAIGFALLADYGSAAVAGTAIACCGLLPQVYMDMVVATLVVEQRYGAAGAIEFTRSAAGTAIVIVLVLAAAGLTLFLAAWAVAALAGAVAARAAAREAVSLRPRFPRGDARAVLIGSLGYSVGAAIHVVYFRAVMLVVSLRAPLVQAGWYGAAFRLTEFLGAAAGLSAGNATPTLARVAADRLEFRRSARRVIGGSAVLGCAVGAALALAAPVIVQIIGGDELKPATAVVRIQAIAVALMFVAFAAGAALFTLRRHRAIALVNAVGLCVAVIAALALVPAHGAKGGAVASCIGEAALLACELGALAQVLRRPAQAASRLSA